MEEFIQFSAKTKNEAITKACIELGVSSDQLEIEVVSEGSSGFFGIGSKPAIIKARKINTVSEEDEIQEIVDTVKVDAIREEQNRKPAKPFVKAEKPAPKSEPVKEKAPVKEAKEPKPFKEPPFCHFDQGRSPRGEIFLYVAFLRFLRSLSLGRNDGSTCGATFCRSYSVALCA